MPWLVPYFWQLIIQRGNRLQWLEASVFLTIITEALSILESPVHHHNRWSSSLPSSQRSDLRRCGWSLHELQEKHATSQHLVRDLQAFGSHQWRTPILMSSRYSSYIIVPIDIAHLDSTWNMGCLRISGCLLMVPQHIQYLNSSQQLCSDIAVFEGHINLSSQQPQWCTINAILLPYLFHPFHTLDCFKSWMAWYVLPLLVPPYKHHIVKFCVLYDRSLFASFF